MTTILVTCALGPYMKGTIECFRNNPDGEKFRIIGTDMSDMVLNFSGIDAFYKVPRCTDENYVKTILNICEKEKVDILIPLNTVELEAFEINKAVFGLVGTLVAVTRGKLAIANDKRKFAKYFDDNGIQTPKWKEVSSYDELRRFVESDPETLYCVKQGIGCGGRGFRLIGSEQYTTKHRPVGNYIDMETLKEMFDNMDEGNSVLVQQYLAGEELSVDVLSVHGDVVCGVERNCPEVEGVPIDSTVVKKDDVYDMCVKACKLLDLDGNVNIDVKRDEHGVPYIIDINPRLSATISLPARAGVNLAYYGLMYHLKGHVDSKYPSEKIGTRLLRRLTDYFIDPDERREQ